MAARDSDGDTVLHLAALSNDEGTIGKLLAHGMDVNDTNNRGLTPLHLSCLKGHLEATRKLIGANNILLNVQAAGMKNLTPAIGAAAKGRTEVLKVLAAAGADLALTDTDGDSVLHNLGYFARRIRDDAQKLSLVTETFRELAKFNPSLLCATNNRGMTPSQVAPSQIRNLIEAAMAPKSIKCVCGGHLRSGTSAPTRCAVCCISLNQQLALTCENENHPCHSEGLSVCPTCSNTGLVGLRIKFLKSKPGGLFSKTKIKSGLIAEVCSVSGDQFTLWLPTDGTVPLPSDFTDLVVVSLSPQTRVQVKRSVQKPVHGWGRANDKDIGSVKEFDSDGDVRVCFPRLGENHVTFRPRELVAHPGKGGITTGQTVFRSDTGDSQIGVVEEVKDDYQVSVHFPSARWVGYVGDLNPYIGAEITVSSENPNHPGKSLIEPGDSYWQSNGSKGSHYLTMHLAKAQTTLHSLEVFLSRSQRSEKSYLPDEVEVHIGTSLATLRNVAKCNVTKYFWTELVSNVNGDFSFIRVYFKSCHMGGMNVRVNGVRAIVGPSRLVVPGTHFSSPNSSSGELGDLGKLGDLGELAALLGHVSGEATDVICLCGSKLILAEGKDSSRTCDCCFKTIKGSEKYLHCQTDIKDQHPSGLDVCSNCRQSGLQGVRVSVLQQDSSLRSKLAPGAIGEIVHSGSGPEVTVRFPGLEAPRTVSRTNLKNTPFSPGLRVQVKPNVSEPRLKWGAANATSVGIVTSMTEGVVSVRFPQVRTWRGLAPELDIHPGSGMLEVGKSVTFREGSCHANGTTGKLTNINKDAFAEVEFPQQKWRGYIGHLDCEHTPSEIGVKVTASSTTEPFSVSNLLTSDDLYWQSDVDFTGNGHWVMLELTKVHSKLKKVEIRLSKETLESEVSYLPKDVEIYVGPSEHSLHRVSVFEVDSYGWFNMLTTSVSGDFQWVKIVIKTQHLNGKRVRINNVRLQVDNDEVIPTSLKSSEPDGAALLQMLKDLLGGGDGNSLELKKGQKVKHFRLIEEIGKGGFGTVWRASDEDLEVSGDDAPVVLKFLHKKSQLSEKMFQDEAKKLNALQHEAIPRLLAFFTDEQDNRVLVMEHIAGKTLRKVVTEQGPLSDDRIKQILNELITVLRYVHRKGVVHRDVKADNIIEKSDGQIVLVDFGCAGQFGTTLATQAQPQQDDEAPILSTRVGTPGYIAPEIEQGKGTIASDFFSLGALGLFLATGTEPYHLKQRHGTFGKCVQQLYVTSQLSAELASVINGLTEPVQRARLQFVDSLVPKPPETPKAPPGQPHHPRRQGSVASEQSPSPRNTNSGETVPIPSPSRINTTLQTKSLPSELESVHLTDWSIDQVQVWLKAGDLKSLAPQFRENLVNGILLIELHRDLQDGNVEWLEEMGVTKKAQQRLIKAELKSLCLRMPNSE